MLARLQKLQLPLVDDGDTSSDGAKIVVQARIVMSSCVDDTSIDYQVHRASPKTRRRQILPTPPPPTAISSSLMEPRRPPFHYGRRKWSSTTALLRMPRHQGILRKSRYSCSAIPTSAVTAHQAPGRLRHGQRNDGHADLHHHGDLKKSVSFCRDVSVFEFAVPQDRPKSHEGWSEYFS